MDYVKKKKRTRWLRHRFNSRLGCLRAWLLPLHFLVCDLAHAPASPARGQHVMRMRHACYRWLCRPTVCASPEHGDPGDSVIRNPLPAIPGGRTVLARAHTHGRMVSLAHQRSSEGWRQSIVNVLLSVQHNG